MKDFPERNKKNYQNYYRLQKFKVLLLCLNYEFTSDKMNFESSENSL